MRFLPFFLLILCLISPCPAQADNWSGTIEIVDGIQHIRNPDTPMSSDLAIQTSLLWRAGGDEESDDVLFGNIVELLLDGDGNTYVLDQQLCEVKMYDAEGRFLRILGRSGEGPGEFTMPAGMFLIPDKGVGVYQMMPSRIVVLDREGVPQSAPSIPGDSGFRLFQQIRHTGPAILVDQRTTGLKGTKAAVHTELISVSPEGDKLATLWSREHEYDLANMEVGDSPENPSVFWETGFGGEIYLNTSYDEYTIQVMTVDGTVTRVIERSYESLERTPEDIEAMEQAYDRLPANMPKMTINIEPLERDVQQMFVRPKGELWVVSSQSARGAGEGELGGFEVFDAKGRYVRNIRIDVDYNEDRDIWFLRNDRLYVVKEGIGAIQSAFAGLGGTTPGADNDDTDDDEPEPLELLCYTLEFPARQ